MRAPDARRPAHLAAGLGFALVTSVGWGLNWPVTKYLLTELPPLSMRGISGLIGAAALALIALAFKEPLAVPRRLWARLFVISVLSVGAWAGLVALALLWLNAGEAAVLGATNPVWVSLLAWPLLGERISVARVVAIVSAVAALAVLFGVSGSAASVAKLPGAALVIAASICVAFGTVLTKRFPLQMPAISVATWQIACGCLVVTLVGLVQEQPFAHFVALSTKGWLLFAYLTFVQFCLCYVCWFAALKRLPASTASTGMLVTPVVGVLASALALHEPLGAREIVALLLTLGSVMLAVRS
jgi:drug/metabolite transporter (DMT)-like permease